MAFRNRCATLAVFLLTFALFGVSLGAAPERAGAARYVVAQCGWRIGQDATWYDLSADRFVRSAYCQVPAPADPLDGVHMTSQAKPSANAIGGTRIAAWRWQAPAGTAIVSVLGQHWQNLRNGFQHRLGGVPPNGSFTPFLEMSSHNATKRSFSKSFSPWAQAFESRLGCYRPSDKICEISGTILGGVRTLTITMDDSAPPTAQIGGALTGTGWLRGVLGLNFSNRDAGSGLKAAQTWIDGALRAGSEMNCATTMISGQWRGTKMQPCPTAAAGTHSIDTRTVSDGPHQLRHCAIDFANATGCAGDRTIRVDNNPPAAPKALAVEGGEGWHRSNGFNLTWSDPPQGAASSIAANFHRLTGSDGFVGGISVQTGSGGINGIQVPGPGEYKVRVWLVDAAGNWNEAHSAQATLRLDDVPPTGYFADPPADDPAQIRVPVADRFSGVAGGSIALRPAAGGEWEVIPTHYSTGREPALTARFPSEMPAGTWILRATVVDRAGNITVTDRRANGSQMTVRTPFRSETTLVAGFPTGARGTQPAIEVGYRKRARLAGRLTASGGAGIGSASLSVTEEPLPGSRRGASTRSVQTDSRGYYDLWLAPGPARRVKVAFAGTRLLEGSSSGTLEMKVQGRLGFGARPRQLKTGQQVRFHGHVKAFDAWHPASGNLVQVQYFEEAARRWRPVALTRTDRSGRFRSSYRFRYITGIARIRLRALLVPNSRFPYSRAASRPVRIRVKG